MEKIYTDDAPDPLGPYSQAIRDGDTLYVSGQGPFDPTTGAVTGDTIEEQTERTLQNLGAVLEAGGSSLGQVMKVNIYLGEIDDYAAVNEVYEEYLDDPYPARAVVEVGDFPVELGIEIECVGKIT